MCDLCSQAIKRNHPTRDREGEPGDFPDGLKNVKHGYGAMTSAAPPIPQADGYEPIQPGEIRGRKDGPGIMEGPRPGPWPAKAPVEHGAYGAGLPDLATLEWKRVNGIGGDVKWAQVDASGNVRNILTMEAAEGLVKAVLRAMFLLP